MFDIERFRLTFPEFADPVKYPDESIGFQASFADAVISSSVWGTSYFQGVSLYVAHMLTLNGIGGVGMGGGSGGLVASKSVGGVSVSYDTTSSTSLGAGWYNSTGYGRQLWYLIRRFGMGCVQL